MLNKKCWYFLKDQQTLFFTCRIQCESASSEEPVNETTALMDTTAVDESRCDNDLNESISNAAGRLHLNLEDTNFHWLFQWADSFEPGKVPVTLFLIGIIFSTVALAMFIYVGDQVSEWWFVAFSIIFLFLATLALIFTTFFKQDNSGTNFKVSHNIKILINTIYH